MPETNSRLYISPSSTIKPGESFTVTFIVDPIAINSSYNFNISGKSSLGEVINYSATFPPTNTIGMTTYTMLAKNTGVTQGKKDLVVSVDGYPDKKLAFSILDLLYESHGKSFGVAEEVPVTLRLYFNQNKTYRLEKYVNNATSTVVSGTWSTNSVDDICFVKTKSEAVSGLGDYTVNRLGSWTQITNDLLVAEFVLNSSGSLETATTVELSSSDNYNGLHTVSTFGISIKNT